MGASLVSWSAGQLHCRVIGQVSWHFGGQGSWEACSPASSPVCFSLEPFISQKKKNLTFCPTAAPSTGACAWGWACVAGRHLALGLSRSPFPLPTSVSGVPRSENSPFLYRINPQCWAGAGRKSRLGYWGRHLSWGTRHPSFLPLSAPCHALSLSTCHGPKRTSGALPSPSSVCYGEMVINLKPCVNQYVQRWKRSGNKVKGMGSAVAGG